MTENKLKTIEDFELACVFKEDLKATAIQDIEHYNTLQGEGDYSDEQIRAVTEYIMWKNNITQEDLKEEEK